MIFNYLLRLVPLSLALAYFHVPPLWVFVTASLFIIPLAEGGYLLFSLIFCSKAPVNAFTGTATAAMNTASAASQPASL